MSNGFPRAVAGCVLLCGLLTSVYGQQAPGAQGFRPVTDAMLSSPDPADWLHWRRTLDGWGYSPLNQINRQNVQQLQLVWSWGLPQGDSQAGPLVSNGVMYVPTPFGGVDALRAATGELLWQYKREFDKRPNSLTMMRSLAIYEDKVFVNTRDAHIVALNALTGKVVWDHQVADTALGYRYSSGPIVVKGKIVAGMTGCERYKNDVCFISAHDPKTGTELWRTATVARPGTPGGDTWGDLPLTFRAGGDAWIPGSYDPATNLIYWSTSQAKPWGKISRGDLEGSELYTNSTLALDPETGKIAWYHQFVPGDNFDMDEVFESVLIDHGGRRSLFKMGKLGILWELDRTTGKYLTGTDLGYQTIYELNRRTGELAFRPGMLAPAGVSVEFCPSLNGVKNWRAMAYHPETEALYIPTMLSCTKMSFSETEKKEGGGGHGTGSTGAGGRMPYHPASPDSLGQFVAMDIKTGKVLWQHRTRLPLVSSALTTAGGLAVVGDSDRYLYIFDVKTGSVLYQTRLASAVQGTPITYAVGGRQYLAVPVGTGDGSTIRMGAATAGQLALPAVNAMFVFALPNPQATGGR